MIANQSFYNVKFKNDYFNEKKILPVLALGWTTVIKITGPTVFFTVCLSVML